MKHALVVPTIRETSILEFLNAWDGLDWEIIVVEDNPEKSFRLIDVEHHYSWSEIDELLGDKSWIISRRDSAIRSFGFYIAYLMGAEHIFTLDDDCLPRSKSFIEEHKRAIEEAPLWIDSVPGYRTRGFPYEDVGLNTKVVMNMGLWHGVPDYDAVQQLSGVAPKRITLPQGHRLIPANQYFPMCGMNVCFKREAAPLMYFPLQGKGWPYRRFDDIWCGVIMKKICDHLGLQVSIGPPHILHSKASNVYKNLEKEAPGIGFHDTFWKTINSISLNETTPIGCMAQLGQNLLNVSANEYMWEVGRALVEWASLFSNPDQLAPDSDVELKHSE